MDIQVFPRPLKGQVNVIGSKSLSHRYVIAAGLALGTSTLSNLMHSEDLDATKRALESLNVVCEEDRITGRGIAVVTQTIDCGASGSTLRFMIPIVMLLDQAVTLIGRDQLPKRPLDIYEQLFKSKGLMYQRHTEHHLPITIKGPMVGGTYLVDGNISSQFITGLMFALPLCADDSIIEIKGEPESEPYIRLTMDVLKAFGVQIQRKGQQLLIPGGQTYHPVQAFIEGDYSQAAFFMVAGLIGQTLVLSGLSWESRQGDQQIIDIILRMNGKIYYVDKAFWVEPSQTMGTDIDLKHIPDLGPILMVLAALSEGETRFFNTQRLKYKESDRLKVMQDILDRFGVKHHMTEDVCVIQGNKSLKGGQVFETHNDHRIAMALLIASIRCDAPITIKNIEVINKSYPTFLDIFTTLGGNYVITQ